MSDSDDDRSVISWNGTIDDATRGLFSAVEKGNENLVIQYIKEGADVNADNPMPYTTGVSHIHVACENDNLNIVRILLDAGTNEDLETCYADTELSLHTRG